MLRGGTVEHPKYAGRRLFGAGINLTHLYQGKIRFLWYMIRDLGLVDKIYRGPRHARRVSRRPHSVEKLWIAAVEGFAIGGHCQILLTMDYMIAAQDAYLTLPARKEGIIPGAANLRLPRLVGDRVARQAIMIERRLPCDSARGPADLRRDRPARSHGGGDRADRRAADELRRGQRRRQPPRVPHRAGAARHVPALHVGLLARAGATATSARR